MVVFDFSLVLFGDMLYYNKVYERDVVDMIDNNTQFFRTQPEKTISVEGILEQVYLALKEKGYEDGKNITIEQQNAQGEQANAQTICSQFITMQEALL